MIHVKSNGKRWKLLFLQVCLFFLPVITSGQSYPDTLRHQLDSIFTGKLRNMENRIDTRIFGLQREQESLQLRMDSLNRANRQLSDSLERMWKENLSTASAMSLLEEQLDQSVVKTREYRQQLQKNLWISAIAGIVLILALSIAFSYLLRLQQSRFRELLNRFRIEMTQEMSRISQKLKRTRKKILTASDKQNRRFRTALLKKVRKKMKRK